MKQAILFLSNKSNEWALKAYYALEQSMQMDTDVYFVYHQQGEELPVSLQSVPNLFPFTSSILQDLGYTPIEEGKLVPGSNHFPLLKFFKEHQEYDYYWMIEDDVRFSGEWKVFFDSFSANHADFLSSVIETKKENRNKFYDKTSMGLYPLIPDGRKNFLFHPVKEEKVRNDGPYKKNAVFVAAGKESLHRQLLRGEADFDLHLLIYDDSYSKFCNDSDFICADAGYKMDMTYRYLHRHPELLEKYEYFFLMDDDIEMSTEEVNKLFRMMRIYNLKIAQPSLVMSYYTYEHTLHNPLCILRYTNFVEMMVPCFSREALIKVLPTFEKMVRGCGIEFHWPLLINTNHQDMAIIDLVCAKHVRPLQPWSVNDEKNLRDYFSIHALSRIHVESRGMLKQKGEIGNAGFLIFNHEDWQFYMQRLTSEYEILGILLHQVIKADEILPLSLLAYAIGDISENNFF